MFQSEGITFLSHYGVSEWARLCQAREPNAPPRAGRAPLNPFSSVYSTIQNRLHKGARKVRDKHDHLLT